MARYRTDTGEFKRQGVEEHPGGGTSRNEPARRHDLARELLRIRVRKDEAGAFASAGPARADRRAREAGIAGLERKVGRPTMDQRTMALDLRGKGPISARRPRGAPSPGVSGPGPAASGPGAGSCAWPRAAATGGRGPGRPAPGRRRPAWSGASGRSAPGSRGTAPGA